MRFLNSFKFMPQSLEKLAGFLSKEKFTYPESHFDIKKQYHRLLLKRKGVFPYTYMDTLDKLSEDKLPPEEL